MWQEERRKQHMRVDRERNKGCEASSGAVDAKSEDVVLQEERVSNGLQNKCLREGVRRIIVSFQLAKNIDQDATVKHGLTIHLGDDVLNLLKC